MRRARHRRVRGGEVLQVEGIAPRVLGGPVRYGKRDPSNPSFVAFGARRAVAPLDESTFDVFGATVSMNALKAIVRDAARALAAPGLEFDAAVESANHAMCRELYRLYPGIPVLAQPVPPFDARKDWERFWCINPLDGRRGFGEQNGQFTVNLALCDRGKPIVGVVFVPEADPPALYYAVKGAAR